LRRRDIPRRILHVSLNRHAADRFSSSERRARSAARPAQRDEDRNKRAATPILTIEEIGAVTRTTFARVVFIGAGVWGIVVLTPLYWLVDLTGRVYSPPADYPHFFYGFLSVAMAWQIVFLVIGSNPARFRPLMIPSVLEKFGHVATLAVLYSQARISSADVQAAGPELLLGILFIVAFANNRASEDIRRVASGFQPEARRELTPSAWKRIDSQTPTRQETNR
jgi:hypothetical protein